MKVSPKQSDERIFEVCVNEQDRGTLSFVAAFLRGRRDSGPNDMIHYNRVIALLEALRK